METKACVECMIMIKTERVSLDTSAHANINILCYIETAHSLSLSSIMQLHACQSSFLFQNKSSFEA